MMSNKKIKNHAADALQEAEARRAKKRDKQAREVEEEFANEFGGRDGPEATRFGDWEKNGITSDF